MTKYERSSHRVDFNERFACERDFKTAERPVTRQPQKRLLVTDGKTYAAWDAHQLLEQLSEADRARPGHPLG